MADDSDFAFTPPEPGSLAFKAPAPVGTGSLAPNSPLHDWIDKDLSERDAAMMKVQDPKARAAVQERHKQEELHEFDPHKEFDI